jgi:hypothetical protein
MGVMAGAGGRVPAGLSGWVDAPLPPLPDLVCGVYVRDGDDTALLEEVAEALAALYMPRRATDAVQIDLRAALPRTLAAASPAV